MDDQQLNKELVLDLFRSAMRQWGAFLQTEIAIERALGVDADTEIQDYILELAPDFVDAPNSLTTTHVDRLIKLFERGRVT